MRKLLIYLNNQILTQIMKRKLLILLGAFFMFNANAQTTSTGVTTLGSTGMTLKIDTDATNVTLTLTGSSTSFLAVGFGGTSMSAVTEMFIWNSTSNRDYTPSGGQSAPSADASQSWTVSSDVVSGSTRTVIATRPLASTGDYTFTNTAASIPIIFAKGTSTSIAQHAGNTSARGSLTLNSVLSNDGFVLERTTSVYPNPSNGIFKITSNQVIDEVAVYSITGKLVRILKSTTNESEFQLNLSDMEKGVYLVEIISQSQKIWRKIAIE